MKTGRRAIRFERLLAAPPERVFAAFVEPAALRRWMCPESFRVAALETDGPRGPGGGFLLTMEGPDGAAFTVRCRYLEARPPELLAFSWRWEEGHTMAGVETRIRIELAPEGAATRFVMTHSGFPDEAEAESHDRGWTGALAKLEIAVTEEIVR